jgi:hypothetical protein
MSLRIVSAGVVSVLIVAAVSAQQGGRGGGAAAGPAPAHANLDYAPPEPATSNGHKLDLYIPSGAGPFPVVIWSCG